MTPIQRKMVGRRAAGFTVVELIVVIAVVALILGIAVPGLSDMAKESALNDAKQKVNAAMTRAKYTAHQDGTRIALRVMPGEWYQLAGGGDSDRSLAGRQVIVVYRWTFDTGIDPTPEFNEWFEERPDSDVFVLPRGVWLAPLKSLDQNVETAAIDLLWEGALSRVNDSFVASAVDAQGDLRTTAAGDFCFADDFLLVFDANRGLVPGDVTADPDEWPVYRVKAADVEHWYDERDQDDYRGQTRADIERHAFSGVVMYDRDALEALGVDDAVNADERVRLLREIGRPYYIHPRTTVLVPADREPQQ